MNAMAAENGRPKPRLVVSGFLTPESFDVYQSLGVESVSFRVPSKGIEEVKVAMDEVQKTIEAAGGQLN
jgi:hypothetical protein